MTRSRTATTYRRGGTYARALLLFLVSQVRTAAQPLPGVSVAAEIPLQQILQHLSENERARTLDLKQYTSTRTYRLYNQRFGKTAEMTVQLTYRAPGSKAFTVLSESGPRALCHRVLRRMIESEVEASTEEQRRLSQMTTENYDFQFARLDRNEGRPVYVLAALPRSKSKYLMRGEVWVDTADLAISRVTGEPAKSPSFWIRDSRFVYQYGKFQSFWLPVSMQSDADARVFGHTEVKVDFKDYQINTEVGVTAQANCSALPCKGYGADGSPVAPAFFRRGR